MPRSFVTLASAVEPTTAERQAVARKALVRAGAVFPKILQEGSIYSTNHAISQANTNLNSRIGEISLRNPAC